VKFVESEDGEIIVRPVGTMREFWGLERSDDEDRSATKMLREERERTTTSTKSTVTTPRSSGFGTNRSELAAGEGCFRNFCFWVGAPSSSRVNN
jgi:hypothetical protein